MQTSKFLKMIMTYLPAVAVIAAIALGALLGRSLYRSPVVSGNRARAQLSAPAIVAPVLFTQELGTCIPSEIYTSLPPKCKTLDGRLIEVPGTANIFVTPPVK